MRARIQKELVELVRIRPTRRPWRMPLLAALSAGIPVLAGAAAGDIKAGIVGSLGSFVFLYIPHAPFTRRMATLMGCAFGLTACYAIGLVASHWPGAAFATIGLLAAIVTAGARQFLLPRPAGLFFVMATSIGVYSSVAWHDIPRMIGLIALGTMVACLLGVIYSLTTPAPAEDEAPPITSPTPFENLVFDPVVIGLALTCALGTAQLLGVEKPYWAPISCLSVIQGVSLRAVWTRPLHRTFGTVVGLALATALLMLPLNGWTIAIALIALTFLIESAVVRNYAFASIFTTPLAILIAEAPRLGSVSHHSLIEARLLDTIIGCTIGIAFGHIMHHQKLRARLIGWFPRPG